jgi:hypothetical protein
MITVPPDLLRYCTVEPCSIVADPGEKALAVIVTTSEVGDA